MVCRLIGLFLLIGLLAWAGLSLAANPLRVQVRTIYPQHMKTVGEAAQYLLEPTGYTLTLNPRIEPDAQAIAMRQIRPQAEGNTTVVLEEALLLLAGDDCRLIVDHPHKLVTFEKIERGQ
jgi:hypothetical protein